LGNARRVLETFSAMFTEQIHLGKSPNESGDPTGTFPTGSLANRIQDAPLGLLSSMSVQISGIFYQFPQSMAVLSFNQKGKNLKPSAVLLLFFSFPTIPYICTVK
jgi:hypothetical protein